MTLRSVSRYENFRAASTKVHRLKRWMAWLAACAPRSWRFPIFGLPARSRMASFNRDCRVSPEISVVKNGFAHALGAHLNQEGAYLPELTLGAGAFMESRFLKKQRCFPQITTVPGRVVSLVSEGQMNYYRWLLETLPRLRFLQENGTTYDKIYVCQKHPFHRETLHAFQIDPAKIIDCETVTCLRAPEIVVPRFVDESEPWIVPWLRAKILPALPSVPNDQPRRRLYISRQRAHCRQVENENELQNVLAPHGFETIHLENFAWIDQVALFQSAEIIIGPHGAGLANLIFCTAPATVIELIAENYPFSFYNQLAAISQLNHHALTCEATNPTHVASSNLRVPVQRVADLLEKMG